MAFALAMLTTSTYADDIVPAPKSDAAKPETYGALAELVSPWQSLSQEILQSTAPDSEANAAAAKVHALLQKPRSAGGMLYFIELKILAEQDPTAEHLTKYKNFQPSAGPEETLAGLEELLPAIQSLQASVVRDNDQESATQQRQRAIDAFAAFNEQAAITRLRAIIHVRE